MADLNVEWGWMLVGFVVGIGCSWLVSDLVYPSKDHRKNDDSFRIGLNSGHVSNSWKGLDKLGNYLCLLRCSTKLVETKAPYLADLNKVLRREELNCNPSMFYQ